MLVVDTLTGRFSSVKLRGRKADCASCGQNPSIISDSLPSFDYKAFTGQDYNDRHESLSNSHKEWLLSDGVRGIDTY